jgi:hypothetical protein
VNKRLFILAAVLTSFSCAGPNQPDDVDDSNRLITSVGTHRLKDGKLTLEIREEQDRLNYHITRDFDDGAVTKVSFAPAEPFLHSGTDWFAFIESDNVVWVFNGQDVLHCADFKDGSYAIIDSIVRPDIFTEAPGAVRDRLPPSFLEKNPDK